MDYADATTQAVRTFRHPLKKRRLKDCPRYAVDKTDGIVKLSLPNQPARGPVGAFVLGADVRHDRAPPALVSE